MRSLKAVSLPMFALRAYDLNPSRSFKAGTLKVNILVPTVYGHFLAYYGSHNDVNLRSYGDIETR